MGRAVGSRRWRRRATHSSNTKENDLPRRRHRGPVRREKPEHRINRHIRFPKIRVVDPDGEMLGVMSPDEGREHARRHNLDLVEVSPNARPPVCKIMDYGKFKYERSKAKSAAKGAEPDSPRLAQKVGKNFSLLIERRCSPGP